MEKISTPSKKRDSKKTRTLSGLTVSKGSHLIECEGMMDELRSQLARLRLVMMKADDDTFEGKREREDFLFWLLHITILMGSQISLAQTPQKENEIKTVSEKHLDKLENEMIELRQKTELPSTFIVSSAHLLSADVDIVRALVRRIERNIVRLKDEFPSFNADILLKFLNRLSDYFFILARYIDNKLSHTICPVDYKVIDQ